MSMFFDFMYRRDINNAGNHPELELVIVRGQPEYHIKRILDERIYRKKRQVLVKWKGYRDPTWELESQVKNTDAFKIWRTDHRPV